MTHAARLKTITADFVMLSKDDAFASTDGGIALADVATGQRLRVTDAAQLIVGAKYLTQSGNTLTRVSNTQLLLEDTPIQLNPPVVESAGAAAPATPTRGGGGAGGGVSAEAAEAAQLDQAIEFVKRATAAAPFRVAPASSLRAAREI